MPNNNQGGGPVPSQAGPAGGRAAAAPDSYRRSFPLLEKLLLEERPVLLDRIEATCRLLDGILKSGSPQEKARARDAMAAYARSLELYRELVDRRDQVVAEASNRAKAPHDK
jgi:hypothetical protein